jgi:hypothetical protein
MKNFEYGKDDSKNGFREEVGQEEKIGAVPKSGRSDLLGEPGGRVTVAIENQLGKMPWVSFLGLSAISMVASVALASRREEKDYASFVGLWAPCFMLLGVYNKLVSIDEKLAAQAGMPAPRADIPSSTAYLS